MNIYTGRFICKASRLVCLLAVFIGSSAYSETVNIKNDTFWDTADGEPIYSQGGGIFKFKHPKTGEENYFWYGVHYKQAEDYRNDYSTTKQGNTFVGVTCYTSTDLTNWKSEGHVLTPANASQNGQGGGWGWMGRMGVAYIEEAEQYVLVIQSGSRVLFAVSDSPLGPFKYQHTKDMTEMIGTSNTGDQTVFTDEDTGKSYLVYSYGQGRNKIYISEIGLKDDMITLLDCTQVFAGSGREGNCMFKYKRKYYLAASNLYGWDSSYAYYLVADDIRGPYEPKNDMQIFPGAKDDYAHITQTGFFVTVRGSEQETVIYCGDRWADFAGNGLGYNQWCPLSFDGAVPYFNSLNSWNFYEDTGKWSVADDNNWIKNASFEADRKEMPSSVKPVQTRLMGWETKVIKGTEISLNPNSPKLNHQNSQYERTKVIGERSLNMSDSVDFTRQVYQEISSSPYVKFEDGEYTMTAKVKNSAGFSNLAMYARSGGKTYKVNVEDENAAWTSITLTGVLVFDNKVEVGFVAEGKANAFCLVDDVALVKVK